MARRSSSSRRLGLEESEKYYVMDNGMVQVTVSKPEGHIVSIEYEGINLLEVNNTEDNRGYWDLVWSFPNQADNYDRMYAAAYSVVENSDEKVELSFTRSYSSSSSSSSSSLPLSIDKRFVLLPGSSGFYTYGIYHRSEGWPDFNLNQTRVVFKLREDKFDFMAIGDNKQRVMPYPEDRSSGNCEALAYKEAVILTNPRNSNLKGEVDDKYQYSCENKENKLHGWICFDPLIGFWMITPSDEFRNGGPLKQNLTSHCGPTCLGSFHSSHYAGISLCPAFRNGEAWLKVFGPVFVYVNKSSSRDSLWNDAKRRLQHETKKWPYNWPASRHFAGASERGSVSGTLIVKDSYASPSAFSASSAWLGLALPGYPGSWQEESKGYQFWTQADRYGNFEITNIRTGTYDLYGWVPGVIGDYKKYGNSLTITKGSSIELGRLVYIPPRNGPTVWEIGVPDRTAASFYVPDADSKYINKLFVNQEKFRQYGLWQRYSELYPDKDLVYTVGSSDWTKDWFFIHGIRINSDGSFESTTWEIRFYLNIVSQSGYYTLHLAIAAANAARVLVSVNSSSNIYTTDLFGKDNAIARHGIHGLYRLLSLQIGAGHLRSGWNSIFLTQNHLYLFSGVMYDYIRLESPAKSNLDSTEHDSN